MFKYFLKELKIFLMKYLSVFDKQIETFRLESERVQKLKKLNQHLFIFSKELRIYKTKR